MTFVPLCPTSCNDGLDRRRRASMSQKPCTQGCIENKNAPKADVRARTRADATLSEASPRPATTDFRAYQRIRASQTMDHGEAPYNGKRTPVMYADVTPDDLCHHRTRLRIKKSGSPRLRGPRRSVVPTSIGRIAINNFKGLRTPSQAFVRSSLVQAQSNAPPHTS